MSVPPRSKITARKKLRDIGSKDYDNEWNKETGKSSNVRGSDDMAFFLIMTETKIRLLQKLFLIVLGFDTQRLLRQSGDKYFVYAATIHVDHFKAQTMPFKLIGCLRNFAQREHHK